MIVIIDYGLGNNGAIKNMLKKIGADALISNEISIIAAAEKLILPGVGAFDSGMQNILNLGLVPVLNEKVLEKKTPILGICLGTQLMTKSSDEGTLPGLGWVDGVTVKFDTNKMSTKSKVPHMGWNTVKIMKKSNLFIDSNDNERFYFVHSYHVNCNRPDDILTTTQYGYDFVSSFAVGNISGVQFHPEKSHRYGMALMKNFVRI